MTVHQIRKVNKNFLHVFVLAQNYFVGEKNQPNKCLLTNSNGKTIIESIIDDAFHSLSNFDLTVVVNHDSAKIIKLLPQKVRILHIDNEIMEGESIQLCLDNSYSNRVAFIDANIRYSGNIFDYLTCHENATLETKEFYPEFIKISKDFDSNIEFLNYSTTGNQWAKAFYLEGNAYDSLYRICHKPIGKKYETYQILQTVIGDGSKIKSITMDDIVYLKGVKS